MLKIWLRAAAMFALFIAGCFAMGFVTMLEVVGTAIAAAACLLILMWLYS